MCGDLVNDLHAEVLAARGARRWLAEEVGRCLNSAASSTENVGETWGSDWVELGDGLDGKSRKWKLKEGVEMVMYVSTLPCELDLSFLPFKLVEIRLNASCFPPSFSLQAVTHLPSISQSFKKLKIQPWQLSRALQLPPSSFQVRSLEVETDILTLELVGRSQVSLALIFRSFSPLSKMALAFFRLSINRSSRLSSYNLDELLGQNRVVDSTRHAGSSPLDSL